MKSLSNALALLREPWEAETTLRNLRLIHEARERRQDMVLWAKQVEQALEKRFKIKLASGCFKMYDILSNIVNGIYRISPSVPLNFKACRKPNSKN